MTVTIASGGITFEDSTKQTTAFKEVNLQFTPVSGYPGHGLNGMAGGAWDSLFAYWAIPKDWKTLDEAYLYARPLVALTPGGVACKIEAIRYLSGVNTSVITSADMFTEVSGAANIQWALPISSIFFSGALPGEALNFKITLQALNRPQELRIVYQG